MIDSSKSSVNAERKTVKFTLATVALSLVFAAPSGKRAAILVQPVSNPTPAEWMKFDTDACGSLDRARGRHSMIYKSSAPDDSDEVLWAEGWGLSDDGTVVAQQWIAQHPGVAIVTDAIDKACDSGALDSDDLGESTFA